MPLLHRPRHRFVAGTVGQEWCARCAAPQSNRRLHPRIVWLRQHDALDVVEGAVRAAWHGDDVTLQAQLEEALMWAAARWRLVHVHTLAELLEVDGLKSDRGLRLAQAAVTQLLTLRRLSSAHTLHGDPVVVRTSMREVVPAYRLSPKETR